VSYTVAICTPPVPADDCEAWGQLEGWIDELGQVPAVFHELLNRLTVRYPCLCDLPDERIDDGVWSDGPLRHTLGHRVSILGIVYPRVEEVLPFLTRTANDLGLVVFDQQANMIHRSG
jgi:hypothetical protein